MVEGKRPPSMQEFDYFADGVRPRPLEEVADGALPEALDGQLQRQHSEERRARRLALLASAALLVALGVLWNYRFWIAYVFSSPQPPAPLGDVANLKPEDVPHNAYVSLAGITEHRGLTQKGVRGLSLQRQEFWYFRLLGSQGVFIEVYPDAEKFGFAVDLNVDGRAVDPELESGYDDVLEQYRQQFHPLERPALRIIQVGVKPGEGRLPYLLLCMVVATVAAIDVSVLRRWLRWRKKATPGLLRAS